MLLWFKLALQLVLAGVFVAAGVAKLRSLPKTREMLIAFAVPQRLVATAAYLLPLSEIAAGAGLLVPAVAWPAAAGATLLLAVFTVAVGINIALGRHLDCNCFGQTKPAPIGPMTLVRNVALTAAAGFVLWARPAFEAGPGIAATLERAAWIAVALSAAAFGALAMATAVVKTFRAMRRRRRSSAASAVFAAFARRAGMAVRPASIGLPVGSPAPDFELPTATHFTVSLRKMLQMKMPVLLVFMSPGCPACEILSLEAEAWLLDTKGSLMIVLVHEGTALRIRRPGLRQLYQHRRELADAFQSWGSPEAVLIEPDGTIGSPLLKGLPAIRTLVVQHLSGNRDAVEPVGFIKPGDGLAMGAEPPAVDLTDQNGSAFTFADFAGRDVLVIFWSATCSYCRVLLDTLKAWEASPPPWAPAVVLLRTDFDDPDAAPTGLELPVAFDRGKELTKAFGVIGTPSGVLLDASGRVASEVAGGVDAIMALANGVSPVAPVRPATRDA